MMDDNPSPGKENLQKNEEPHSDNSHQQIICDAAYDNIPRQQMPRYANNVHPMYPGPPRMFPPQSQAGMHPFQAPAGMFPMQAGMFPPQAHVGMFPPQSQAGFHPPQSQAGFYPPQSQAGFHPPQAQAGFYPPQTQAGMNPPQSQAGMNPPQSQAGMNPPQAQVGLHPPQAPPEMIQEHFPEMQSADAAEISSDISENATEDDSTSDESEDKKEVKAILVSGLSKKISEKSLRSYFGNRRKSGGGEISTLTLNEEKGSAIIYFTDENAVDRIMTKAPHLLEKTQIEVSLYETETRSEDTMDNSLSENDEDESKTIEVRGFKPETSDDTIECYFENPRKGGGEIAELRRKDDVIYITFVNAETVTNVMEKSPHKIGKRQLEVSVHKPERKEEELNENVSDSEKEEVTSTIEVRGFGPETSDDTIECYFENPRKGGGEILDFKRYKDECVIHITFKDLEVAEKIVKMSHKIERHNLEVRHYIPQKPRPTYDDRLLITGIKSTTTKDCLINYLEAKGNCEIDESKVVYGDEEGTVVVHFTKMPDIERFQKVCSQKPLEGNFLTVSRVEVSNSIIVRGVKPKTSEDTILYYFEGKRSGNVHNVEVEKVQIKSDDGCCLVYFKDHSVIEQILQHPKGHKLDGATLNVSIYHECLGTGGGVCDPTWFKMPDPLTVTDLDKYKLAFIKQDRIARKGFEKQLKACYSELNWMKEDDTTILLKCTLTEEVPSVRTLSRSWAANVESAVKEYLNLLEVEEINILQATWDEVHQKLDLGEINGADLFDCKDSSKLIVVGFARQGKSLAEKVKTVVKKVEEEYERRKQEVSETLNKVNSIQLRLLLARGFPKLMKEKYPDLTVTIKLPKIEISFVGIIADVKTAQIEMYELLQSKKQSRVADFSADQLQMVDKKCVRDYIVKKIKKKNLVGVWEVTDKDVAILALSDDDAVHVANIIKQSVIEKVCTLEPESLTLLSSDKWSNLISGLSQSHGDFLHISQQEMRKVVITATDDVMANVSEDISNFFTENTIFVQTVTFPKGIQRFLQEYCDENISKITNNLKQLQVQISYSKTGEQFTINATKFGMDAAMKALEDLASKVNHKMFLHKRPGIQKLLKSQKGIQFINSLERSEKCIIEKSFDSSEKMSVGNKRVMETTAVAGKGVKIVGNCIMPGQRQLFFVEGDITQMKVDVIVNAANERLDHIGGLAKAIVDRGGKSIQDECRNYVRNKGNVDAGNIAISKPGALSCKMIVHAVGPVWSGGHRNEEETLREAIFNSLEAADNNNCHSIAIPALSCGIYGYPLHKATAAIVEAIKEHFKDFPTSSLHEIYLTDSSINTVKFFMSAGKQVFGGHNEQMKDGNSFTKPPVKKRGDRTSPSTHKSSTINIHLVKGEIAKQQADIIVNTTSNNLDLQNGAVSKTILAEGGQILQSECRRNYPKGIQHGEIAVTTGGNLKCQKVFHTCLPNWTNDQTGEQVLSNLIFDCMKKASQAQRNSIAFPALGTGNLGYPRDVVAKCFKTSVKEFERKYSSSPLRDVNIVVYPKDTTTVQAFEDVISSSSGPSSLQNKTNRKNRKFGPSAMETDGDWQVVSKSDLSDSLKIGSVVLSVKQGDITKEKVDCIVNSTNDRLDFSQGGVSQAIAKKCGRRLKDECKQNLGMMKKKGIVSTTAEGLHCKAIIHIDKDHFKDNWKNIISSCLSEAEHIPAVSSIAFPALGTGMGGSSSEDVASAFVSAIKDYDSSQITDVRIIIFQADMFKSFTETVNKAAAQKGFFSRISDKVSGFFASVSKPQEEDYSSEMQLHYFSDNLLSIDASIQAVESYCGEEIIKKVIADESLQNLKKNQMKKILDLQNQFQVRVTLSGKQDMITIEGLQVDVYNAYELVQKLLREFDRLESEQDMANILSNIVQWFYVEVDQQGQTKQVPYDKKVNGIIEKAYKDKQDVSLEASGQKYIIDFNTMEEYPENDITDRVKVVRKDLMKVSAFEAPSHWTPMGDNEDVKVVTLQTSEADYLSVSQAFLNSVQQQTAKIIKIERIQNKTLYQQYVAKRNQITKQRSQPAERKLWHGTSSDAIVSLNTYGFNRSYCGKNATVHGDGVYFAVNASYSARHQYSRPDSQGHKHMYYASVLTGDFTTGQQGMRVPPVKSSNQTLLYDSVVDNVANPGMFIIFNDTQAYPDYLITFTL